MLSIPFWLTFSPEPDTKVLWIVIRPTSQALRHLFSLYESSDVPLLESLEIIMWR